MASLGIVLHASLSCMVVSTIFCGTASEKIVDKILQRLEKVKELNFDLKQDNVNLQLEMTDIRGENRELKETLNEMKIWMKTGHFPGNNKMDESISDLKKENLKFRLEIAELRVQMNNVIRENRELKEKWNEIEDIMIYRYIHRNKSRSEIQSGIKPVHQTPPSYKHVKETIKVQRISKFLFDIISF